MPSSDPTQKTEEARWAKIFKALGHPLRYRLYLEACSRPLTVTELVSLSGRSQPAVSQYLNALRRAGLVRVTRRGRNMIYESYPMDWSALDSLKAMGLPRAAHTYEPATVVSSGDSAIFPEFSPAAPAAAAVTRDTEDIVL